MKHFFQDLWQDLRDKRMWPFAAVLVVLLVALPVVLSEKRKEPKPAPASANAQPEQLPSVEISDDTVFSSNLQAFKAKDPFKPGQQTSKDLTESSARVVDTLPDSSGGSSSLPEGSGGGDSAGGGTTSAGSEGSGGSSGDSGGGGSTPSPSGGTKRVSYSYVADVTFGRAGSERRHRGLERLEMLPNADSPLLVFLGATRSGGDAVFLVDSNLRQAGEGSCADSACSVLSIGPGSEHRFKDDQGREYVLVIDRIRRVRAGASSASAGASARTAVGSREAREERRRGLVSALLVDTETVTTAVASRPVEKGR